MFGFNWIDAIIVVLLVAAVIEGLRVGFVTQFLVAVGFIVSLFAAGWLFPRILLISDANLRNYVNAACVLIAAIYVAARCYDLGQKTHWSFRIGALIRNQRLKSLETILGCIPSLLGGLLLVWLLGVAIIRMPFAGLSNSASDSRIIQSLIRELPPVPAVIARFSRQLSPNAQPYVFTTPSPYSSFNYSAANFRAASKLAAASVVRITSFSCGGIVSGSGFAIQPDLIATNAHVIAGSRRPIIKYQDHSYVATPVYFDPTLDLAFLRVDTLRLPALSLNPDNVQLNTTVAILGYPGGNYRPTPGIIRDVRAVSAKTIYDQGAFGRGIYDIQADVQYGNSGGPAVLEDGRVAGIIFSKSDDTTHNAFALTAFHIAAGLQKVTDNQQPTNTGACMVR